MNSRPVILVVEDQANEREAMTRLLRLEKYEVLEAANPADAVAYMDGSADLLISDLRMGNTSGIDLLRLWKKQFPSTPIILVTAYGEVGSAVTAMKLGAEDYLSKPVNPDELLALVARCLETRRKEEQVQILRSRLDQRLGFTGIVGQSDTMAEVFEQARRAALVDSTVLITGESGTGKELFAQAIHENSKRKGQPFITINMAAVPENLVESELFGHMKGSFTGATDSRMGRFESADNGTLFIDEIGDFAMASQAKLLRVLENGKVTPVGSNDDRQVDVRVVAATSRPLEEMVAKEEFREDLYYRLNVVNIQLPPLRERREDIPVLLDFFLRRLCQACDRPLLSLEPDLVDYLCHYDWPGNVRQLSNCLESMVVLARGDKLTLDDLPATVDEELLPTRDIAIPHGTSLEELERAAVRQALEDSDGNRTHAARALGISVRTLQRKLKSWEEDGSNGSTDSAIDSAEEERSSVL